MRVTTEPESAGATKRVRVGIGFPPEVVRLERTRLLDLVDQINASHIDHVGVADHVSFRGGRGNDALSAMHYLAGLGIEREIHAGVLILPLRHPTLVARQLLDLADIHAPGVVAGVGLGGDDVEEFTMLGMETKERGRRMDDALSVLLELLAAHRPIDRDGFYPTKGPGLERRDGAPVSVLVGGRVDRAHERAAQADGWLAAFSSPSRFGAGAERVHELNPAVISGYQAWYGVGADGRAHADAQLRAFYGMEPAPFERYVPVGGSDELAEHFEPYIDAGASLLNISPAGDMAQAIDEISTFAAAMNANV